MAGPDCMGNVLAWVGAGCAQPSLEEDLVLLAGKLTLFALGDTNICGVARGKDGCMVIAFQPIVLTCVGGAKHAEPHKPAWTTLQQLLPVTMNWGPVWITQHRPDGAV